MKQVGAGRRQSWPFLSNQLFRFVINLDQDVFVRAGLAA